MSGVVLYHHALGRTDGVLAFADDLRAAGHEVHVPDLFDGRTFGTIEEGVAHAQAIGFDAVVERASAATPSGDLVLVGMSLGCVPAMVLGGSRPGTPAVVQLHSCVPPQGPWRAGVPIEIHVMEDDAWGDVDDARELAATMDEATLHLYAGDRHVFTDRSSAEHHDPAAAAVVLERLLAFLDGR